MNIDIRPKTVFFIFLFIIIFLLIANVIGIILKFYFDQDFVYGLVPLFNFDTERNIPTLYSSIALILCSLLLSFIAMTNKKLGSSYLPWAGLAVIFLFLSIDETASIHERLIDPVRESLNTSGMFHFAWVIPYSAAVLVFFGLYFRFLITLQKKVRVLFIVSGITFVTGAIGLEMISGLVAESYGVTSLTFSFITTCEEFLEKLGIVIFIYALLVYITEQFDHVTLTIKSD